MSFCITEQSLVASNSNIANQVSVPCPSFVCTPTTSTTTTTTTTTSTSTSSIIVGHPHFHFGVFASPHPLGSSASWLGDHPKGKFDCKDFKGDQPTPLLELDLDLDLDDDYYQSQRQYQRQQPRLIREGEEGEEEAREQVRLV